MEGLSGPSGRWHGQRSAFAWEQEALDFVRGLMPEAEPYRAWQTFTFTSDRGHVREADLFIATPAGLFLVEIKSHPGTATNNGSTWLFRDGGALRTFENPLHFTDQKAKELKSLLDKAAGQLKIREHVPRVEAAVFLSGTGLVCRFDEFQRQRVYGRDDRVGQTHLPGIWGGFLNQPPASERNRVTPAFSRQLPKLMERIGIGHLHKAGRVGPYELAARSFDTGPTWADYIATNPSLPKDEPRRVRVYLTGKTAAAGRAAVQRAAHREYLALQGISHDGIVRAEQYSDELLAGPAVVFRHGGKWQRLDHFLNEQHLNEQGLNKQSMASPSGLPLQTRLEMIRQLAEALDHAHRSHLYHRALAARCVYVELDGRYPRLRIADWQVAARPHGTASSAPGTSGARHPSTQFGGRAALLMHVERSAGAYLAPEFGDPDVPAALLDVFGLGALSYLILTGQPPADSRQQLAAKLTTDRALVPSAVADSVSPAMDDLVSGATQRSAADRTESVRQFLRQLDGIEEEITAPEAPAEKDPLTAGPGDDIGGWRVERVLGKGSTSRAFLVTRDGTSRRVFKVAVSEQAARRLRKEAGQLGPLNDSHVARLLDAPFEAGPPLTRRTVIGVEYVEGDTLAEELRRHGPLAVPELERLGEDLFQALRFLDRRGIWHRDIKPDNLVLRELERKGRELVLIDFSLAGTPDSELGAGTKDYLDPFLGKLSMGRRDRYDQAAELYAVAVTLHEMASGELPSWGDGMAGPDFLDPDEEVQLSADLFDPVARDGLEDFFRVALNRDAARRFSSLQDMTRAWTDVFRDLDTVPPLTTSATRDGDEEGDGDPGTAGDTGAGRDCEAGGAPAADRAARAEAARAKRAQAIRDATPATPIGAAGLSPYALSVAMRRLAVSTAGDLAAIPAARITRLRGIGSVPRYELVRLSRDWRQRFGVREAGLHRADVHWPARPGTGTAQDDTERARALPGGPRAAAESAEALRHLPVDEVARRLVPAVPDLERVTGLAAGPDGRRVPPWAGQQEIARLTGIAEAEVAAHLARLRNRWAKTVKELTPVRDDLAEILREHGRVLGWRQLAVGLLARRGSGLSDSAERLRLAGICVRAAVETEERLEGARMASRRLPGRATPGDRAAGDRAAGDGAAGDRAAGDGAGDGTALDDRVLIALTRTGDEAPAPREDDLFAYAELLGEEADRLAARDPLPGVTEIRLALRDVDTAEHAMRLSDTDLVLLAAAASQRAAATPRLELYPRGLPAQRAVKISQAGSIAQGATAEELVRRVLARFPDLDEASRPTPETIPGLLRSLGYDVTRGSDRKLYVQSGTLLSGSRGSGRPRGSRGSGAGAGASPDARAEALEHAAARLDQARRRGGFVALKAPLRDATAICEAVAARDGVTAVNVTAAFVRFLRETSANRPKLPPLRWETVLAADSEDASPAAKTGFGQLLRQAWNLLEDHVRTVAGAAGGRGTDGNSAAAGRGIVLLHDATPLARYAGGGELLARLTVAARDATESPFGLWLLLPMEDPQGPPRLDRVTVSVIPGDAEQLYVPEGFGRGKERKAS